MQPSNAVRAQPEVLLLFIRSWQTVLALLGEPASGMLLLIHCLNGRRSSAKAFIHLHKQHEVVSAR
jgi:hypothetical protein